MTTSSKVIPIIDAVTAHTCAHKCLGHVENHGGCCTVKDRDYIIGPIRDPAATLLRIQRDHGRWLSYSAVFVDHEEGSQLFPYKPTWQDPNNYPALRLNDELACQLYSESERRCTIYEARPDTCRAYRCGYLTETLARVL